MRYPACMSKPDEQKEDLHVGRGLLEFAMRFTTFMMEAGRMPPEEADGLLKGVEQAMRTGRLSSGLSQRYADARGKLLRDMQR